MLDFTGCFGDPRIDRRVTGLVGAIVERQTTVIRRLADDRTTQVGYYRVLANENLEATAISTAITKQCAAMASSGPLGHVLVFNDTTEINFQGHTGRIRPESGLGKVGNNTDIGLFLHVGLAVEAESHRVVGISYLKHWTRQQSEPTTRNGAHKRLPIEQKESYRWIETMTHSRQHLPGATRLTLVGDAESDIYEFFSHTTAASVDLLVRSRGERCIAEGTGKLNAYLAAQTALGRYEITLQGDRRKKHDTRVAVVEVRSAAVHLLRPTNLKTAAAPQSVALNAIWVREIPESIPAGHHGVDWMLLTTHSVSDLESACQVIAWYAMRWNIEQLFRLLKRQGLNIESSELENGEALIRLTLLSLLAALRVMILLLARDSSHAQSIDAIFSGPQQELLESINATMRGSSAIKRNPHPAGTVAWACWIIARLGGWKGLDSERPPGPITLFNGLHRFEQLFDGWTLARAASG